MVYSATSASAAIGGGNSMYYLKRQGLFALVGLALLLIARRWNYRSLRNGAGVLVIGTLGLLCFALVAGQNINGARRWIALGGVTFQPSEVAKLALCVWVALYLTRRPVPRTLAELTKPIGLVTALFCALILAEPDLGTVITLCVMVGAMLLVAGAPMRMLGAASAHRRRADAHLDLVRAVPAHADLQLHQPLARRAGCRLPDRAGDDRARLGRDLRRRPRPGSAEGLLPPRGSHGHDLRDHRRGARARRRHARDSLRTPRSAGQGCGSRSAAATRSGRRSRRASRRSSAGRPR